MTKTCLKPRVIHGTPITPNALLEQLRGESFCVSFAAPAQLERVLRVQDKNGMLMLDNGAFTVWRQGKGKVDREAFFSWANAIQARCEVAVAVIPDVIEGSESENWLEAAYAVQSLSAYPERLMFVWHMNDSLEQLKKAAMLFNFVAIGSCAEYDVQRNRAAYLERLKAANMVIESVAWLYGRRPWTHLMRGLAVLPEAIRFSSADSSNIARNHNRTKGNAGHVRAMANRIRGAVARVAARAAVSCDEPCSNFSDA